MTSNTAQIRAEGEQLAQEMAQIRTKIAGLKPPTVDEDNQVEWEKKRAESQSTAQKRLDHFHDYFAFSKADLDRVEKQRQGLQDAQAELRGQHARLLDPNQASDKDRQIIDSLHQLCGKHPTPFALFMQEAEHGQVKTALLEQQNNLDRQLQDMRTQLDFCAEFEQQIFARTDTRYAEIGQTLRDETTAAVNDAIGEARERVKGETQARLDLQSAIDTLEARQDDLVSKLTTLEVSTAAAELEELNLEAAQKEADQLREQRDEQDIRATNAENTVEQLKKELTESNTRAVQAQNTVEQLKKELTDCQKELVEAQKQLAESNTRAVKAENMVEQLQKQLDEQDLRASQAQNQLAEQKTRADNAEQALQVETRAQSSQIQGLQDQFLQADIGRATASENLGQMTLRAERAENDVREEKARSEVVGREIGVCVARVMDLAARFPSSGLGFHDAGWVDALSRSLHASRQWPDTAAPPAPYQVLLAAAIPARALADQSGVLAVFAAACAMGCPLAVSLSFPLPARAEPILRACIPSVRLDEPLGVVLLWQLVSELRRLTGGGDEV